MNKKLLIEVIILVFFIFSNIYAQQDIINTENAAKTDSIVEQVKPANINGTNSVPNSSKEAVKDKPGNLIKESPDIQQTQTIVDAKDANQESDKDTKKTEQKQLTIIKPTPGSPANSIGLMEINDGDFKYKRIPGISLNVEKPAVEKYAEIKVNDDKELPAANDNKETGLFGISKSTAIILLLIVLIVVIIVFKVRSKGPGGKNVLRRFPGMK